MEQGAEYLSVQRRPMDIEDYIDIIRRHWAWIIGPTFGALVAAVVVAFLWPDTFVSYAVMRITPAQIPERIVASNFNMQMAERLNTMLQDVTSRDSLIGIIRKFNLYPAELKKKPLEDVVEDMRTRVRINILDLQKQSGGRPSGSAFRIEFSYDNSKDAQNVVKELVSAFSNQNLIVRRRQSNLTTDFLSDELKVAKENLDRIEGELTTFRQQNAGRLPEELGTNLQQLNSLEMQVTQAADAVSRAGQDKLMLETHLQNLRRQAASIVTSTEEEVAAGPRNERSEQLSKAILDQETGLEAMREMYREEHPDIRTTKARIEVLKRERDRLASADAAASKGAAKTRKTTNPLALKMLEDLNSSIAMAQGQIQIKMLETEDKIKAQARMREQIKELQARIQARPVGENQYAKLARDYTLAKSKYDEMNLKKSQSEMANKLEERSAGENLELLDPASLPRKPTQPNRWMIVGIGVGLGVGAGLCLAGAREMKDATLKNLKDVRAYTNLPVLSSIPLLENALLVRRKRRLLWLAWSSAMTLGIMTMSGAMYYYYFGMK